MDAKVHAAVGSHIMPGDEPLECAIDVDTFSAPPAEQFDLFRSWHEGIGELEPLQDRFQSFPAQEMAWDLGMITALRVELPSDGKHYRWRHLKRATVDNWYVFLPLSRDQSSGEKRKAGSPAMECYAEPFEYIAEDDAFVVLCMPRSLPFMQSSRVEIRDESSLFLADFMLLLDRSLPDLRVADVPHIVAATTSLLNACLVLSRDHVVEARTAIDAVVAERASKMIERKLNDPDLTPERLCRELGVSRSRLYRIFEPVGGVSNYIRRKRLLRTRDMLADSSDGRPISTIAEQWGFTDASTFSRMFRHEFGIAPKEARAEGWRGGAHVILQQNSPQRDKAHMLGNLLLQNSFGLQTAIRPVAMP